MVETRFPRWSDSPPQFLIWEADELIPMLTCIIISLPTRNLMAGIIVGVILMKAYIKIKERLPAFFYLHYLWILGVWEPKPKNVDVLKGYITTYRE